MTIEMRLFRLCWLGAAPGTPAMVKAEAGKKGLKEHAANIPALGITLISGSLTNKTNGKMRPKKGDLVSKKWGMYPLILVSHLQETDY